MGNKSLLSIIFVSCLLISACKAQTVPVVSTPVLPADTPTPPSTATIGPFTIGGEFVLTNTSAPGTDVGIETMNILLEYRPPVEDSWEKIEVNCSFNPPAPTILKDELHVQYTCQYQKQVSVDAELRVTAEVKIFGNDEVFRLIVEPP